jgi:hypothetical protein
MIIFLESDSREIRVQKEITDHIVDFYKTLFIPSNSCAMHLKENFCPSHMQLNESEKIDLVKLFGMDDVKGVVMDMKVALVLCFFRNLGYYLSTFGPAWVLSQRVNQCWVSLIWMVMQGQYTEVYPGSGKRRP